MVNLTLDSCFRKNLCCFLEGSGRKEGFCLNSSLCDTEKHRRSLCKAKRSFARIDTFLYLLVFIIEFCNVNNCTVKKLCVAAFFDANLACHLTCDNFDMLIVDLDILALIHTLNFAGNIIVSSFKTLNSCDVCGSEVTFCDKIAAQYVRTFFEEDLCTVRNGIYVIFAVIACDDNVSCTFSILNANSTGVFRKCSNFLGSASFEDFFNTGKTLRNIGTCDTTCMERSHSKLCTGFTDGLSRDYADSFASCNKFTCCKVITVALSANTVAALTLEDGTNVNLFNACGNDLGSLCRCNKITCFGNNFARCGVGNSVNECSAGKSFFEFFDRFVSVNEVVNPNTFCCTAVCFANDNFLGNVNKTACKVTGVSCFKSRIRKRFTRTTRTYEVLKHRKAFAEVTLNGKFHCFTGCGHHKTAHTGKLFHLGDRTTGTGITHHLDRIVSVKTLLEGIRYVLCSLIPNRDNASVAFVVGKKTAAEVLCDSFDFLFSIVNDLLLLGRYYHIENGDGDRCSCGIFITVGLDSVKHFSHNGGSVHFDCTVNDLAELALSRCEVNFKVKEFVGIASVNVYRRMNVN